MPFEYKTTVKLHDTDAAGLLFFGNQFRIVHDAYQVFLDASGCSLKDILKRSEFLVPIVHAEADYLKPVTVDDSLTIVVTAAKVSTHSFTLDYKIKNDSDDLIGTARTVHVTVDRDTKKKIVLPVKLRSILESLAEPG